MEDEAIINEFSQRGFVATHLRCDVLVLSGKDALFFMLDGR